MASNGEESNRDRYAYQYPDLWQTNTGRGASRGLYRLPGSRRLLVLPRTVSTQYLDNRILKKKKKNSTTHTHTEPMGTSNVMSYPGTEQAFRRAALRRGPLCIRGFPPQ